MRKIKIFNNYQLKDIMFYKIGTIAKYFIQAKNKEDVLSAIDFYQKQKLDKILIIGLGSNTLITKENYDGLVLQIVSDEYVEAGMKIVNNDIVEVYGGKTLDNIIKFGFKNNLVGLEWAGGLPGTVGAGIRGNVGAFGGEMKESVVFVDTIFYTKEEFEQKRFNNKGMKFDYRSSILKEKKGIILSCVLKFRKVGDSEILRCKDVYNQNIEYRQIHHPLDQPNCGSVFKNIVNKKHISSILRKWPEISDNVSNKWHGKIPMGSIIQKLGFSGLRIGGAQISRKHSNFIVNIGDAKAKDILALIDKVQNKVLQEFSFKPEIEIELVD